MNETEDDGLRGCCHQTGGGEERMVGEGRDRGSVCVCVCVCVTEKDKLWDHHRPAVSHFHTEHWSDWSDWSRPAGANRKWCYTHRLLMTLISNCNTHPEWSCCWRQARPAVSTPGLCQTCGGQLSISCFTGLHYPWCSCPSDRDDLSSPVSDQTEALLWKHTDNKLSWCQREPALLLVYFMKVYLNVV